MTGDPDPRAVAASDALAHLRRVDPVLAHLIATHPDFDPRAWLTDLPPMDAFGALVFQIAGQQLSVAATRRILERLGAAFGGRLPEPAELLALDASTLRGTGLSGRKAETLRAVAAQFADGTLSDHSLRALSDEEIEASLTTIAGIGPWTVHGMLIIAFDRPDVVLAGDLALRKVIRRVYDLDRLPTQEDVLRIAEPWRPYRSLATAYLFGVELETPAPT